MSNPTVPFSGMKKKIETIEAQIAVIDKNFGSVATSISEINKDLVSLATDANKMISKNNEDVNEAIETQASALNAVMSVLSQSIPNFQKLVEDQVVAGYKAKFDAKIEQDKSRLQDWKAKGFIQAVPQVTPKSILVLQDVDTKVDPTVITNPFVLAQFSMLKDEHKELFTNKSIGDSVMGTNGIRSDILEIWEVDDAAVKESAASEQTKDVQ